MAWELEGTDDFEAWYAGLSGAEQADVIAVVDLLEEKGPHLDHPYTSGISTSRHAHMRELRIQHAGRPYRVLYALRSPTLCHSVAGWRQDGQRSPVRRTCAESRPSV